MNLQQLVLRPRLESQLIEDDATAAWEQLTSLTALRMSGFSSRAPSCLDRLTQLRSLHLARHPGGSLYSGAEAEVLQEALPALQQLTHLGLELVLPSPPSSLSALGQHMCSFGFLSYEDPTIPGDPGQLPAGPWLGGLRRLAGTCTFLAASLPALAAASQLQELSMLFVANSEQQSAESLLQWAAGRAVFPRVRLECQSGAWLAAELVAQQFPQLPLDVHEYERSDDEYNWAGIFPDLPPVPRSLY